MIGYYNILVLLLVIICLQIISSLDTVGFKSIIKCREYQRASIENRIRSDPDAIVYPGEILSRSSIQEKEATKSPFSVYLYGNGSRPLCGGVLISERFVLTSAHCISNQYQWRAVETVAIGQNAFFAAPNQRIKISRSSLHPKYKVDSVYHDIGVLELEKDVQIAPDVRPACLQATNTIVNHEWFMNARISYDNNTATWETIPVTEFESNACQKQYEDTKKTPYGVIGHLQICIEITGDPRNPIFLRNKGQPGYTIIGIPSIGHAVSTTLPQVYTRVSYYINWIESLVWPNEPQAGCNKFLFAH